MAHQLREKIDKWDYVKLKSFCTKKKEIVSKLKRLPMEWGSYISDKGLITKYTWNSKTKLLKKINDSMEKWAKELNRAFSKEEVQMAKNHMKKFSTSLDIFDTF
jgi:uncharacterized protein YjgD (DUF1641 family)